jgi:hypothetical protein
MDERIKGDCKSRQRVFAEAFATVALSIAQVWHAERMEIVTDVSRPDANDNFACAHTNPPRV